MPLISYERFDKTGTSLAEMRRSSDVTSVRPCTSAVAKRNRSAGSRWDSEHCDKVRATSFVTGASFIGAISNASWSQDEGSSSRVILFFSHRRMNSQTLMGESHSSFSRSRSALVTRGDSWCGSKRLQSQMCVSSRSFTAQAASQSDSEETGATISPVIFALADSEPIQ
jgi:hypothetical protein